MISALLLSALVLAQGSDLRDFYSDRVLSRLSVRVVADAPLLMAERERIASLLLAESDSPESEEDMKALLGDGLAHLFVVPETRTSQISFTRSDIFVPPGLSSEQILGSLLLHRAWRALFRRNPLLEGGNFTWVYGTAEFFESEFEGVLTSLREFTEINVHRIARFRDVRFLRLYLRPNPGGGCQESLGLRGVVVVFSASHPRLCSDSLVRY